MHIQVSRPWLIYSTQPGIPLNCPLFHWYMWPPCLSVKVKMLVTQSCLTLCNCRDCSLPGSSVHGILWARILEWVAISYSWGSSKADSLPLSHLENPNFIVLIHFKDCWACMYTVILLYVYFGNYWSIHKFKFKVFSHFNSFLTYYERYMWLAREAM